jgi:hypothetical protein
MSLIFDGFPSKEKAEAFVSNIREKFGLNGLVFDDVETAMEHDVFPYELNVPIVHIDRPDMYRDDALKIERRIQQSVKQFGGVFAGT